ncbi:hypothetical protein JCM19298_1600 [Nonlabens ulvanivorans]|nr:hypothetical protein [Nonlabens ulvanivorans]GAK95271.1 hypothetical protein JCM19298_1600 [Nonlabens ulvanivorans]
MKYNLLYIIPAFILISCTNTSTDDLTDNEPITELVTYNDNIAAIIQNQCTQCHNTTSPSGGLVLENYDDVRMSTETGSLIDRITRNVGDPLLMPQNGQLPPSSINLITQWQTDGYLEN